MSEHDLHALSHALDRTKSTVFLDKHNAAFLGSLMCSLDFKWTDEIPTAGTNGVELLWNPDYFQRLPPASRTTDLSHELWHVALLHQVRRGSRNAEVWNIACDIKIDWMLKKMSNNFSFEGIDSVLDHAPYDDPKYIDWVEEDIYDDLMKNPPPKLPPCTCCASKMQLNNGQTQQVINTVVQAVHQAKLAGQAGKLPGAIEATLKKFLEPVIPWQTVLMKFFTDLLDEDYTWARPNRRYQDMYLPSKFTDDGRLEHLMYFQDVSGSISDKDSLRFNSEVKYIQEVLKPQKLSLVQFDTIIQDVKVFNEDDPFDEIKITGRGGTSLVCVRNYIQEHKPTAAIIFSDMEVDPMKPLDPDIPVIWVAIRNRNITVPFGKLIHID